MGWAAHFSALCLASLTTAALDTAVPTLAARAALAAHATLSLARLRMRRCTLHRSLHCTLCLGLKAPSYHAAQPAARGEPSAFDVH